MRQFSKVRRLMESVGMSGGERDWAMAFSFWRGRDPDQKRKIDEALMLNQPDWVPKTLPQNYIGDGKYERILAAKEAPQPKTGIIARAENW